ncbi:MAG: iron transporter [Deltaproteobacteria bacterium]|nr:iron transporter [Deltaproteobacteria bacterium]
MEDMIGLLKKGAVSGVGRGWRGFLWTLKIIVPVSFATTLLDWSGWLNQVDFLFNPLMGLLSLPSMAAVPILIGMLTGIYGTVAAMAVLPFTTSQMTLMAIFVLNAHNLVQEGIIQAKSGINPIKATLYRLASAIISVIAVAPWLPAGAPTPIHAGAIPASLSLSLTLEHWLTATLFLMLKVFIIIMTLMTVMEIIRSTGWIHPLVRFLSPLLKLMGLDKKVGFLWMTAVIFGLAYGGAILVEEIKNGNLSEEERETLHLSIGINHSLVEDPALFFTFGLSPFWLYVPRLLVAMASVRLIRLWQRFRVQEQA